MTKILDIHTHNTERGEDSIINLSVEEYVEFNKPGQAYSIGLHPWDINPDSCKTLDMLMKIADNKNVVAIGETGIDTIAGQAPLFQQMLVMKRHIEISEHLSKPLIIHNVKAHDIIIGLCKEYRPKMPWIIHGFRNKPAIAKMLLEAGCHLSYGKNFNTDSLMLTPENRLLAETDDANITIDETLKKISEAYGHDVRDKILQNTKEIFENIGIR